MRYFSVAQIAELLELTPGAVRERTRQFTGGRKREGRKGLEYPLSGLPQDYRRRIAAVAPELVSLDEACSPDDLVGAHYLESKPGQRIAITIEVRVGD